jgi:hypothetical protein
MLAINREVALSINANLDNPQGRKVAFKTSGNNTFFIEMAMDKTTFVMLEEFDPGDRANADDIIASQNKNQNKQDDVSADSSSDADDLLDSLGI